MSYLHLFILSSYRGHVSNLKLPISLKHKTLLTWVSEYLLGDPHQLCFVVGLIFTYSDDLTRHFDYTLITIIRSLPQVRIFYNYLLELRVESININRDKYTLCLQFWWDFKNIINFVNILKCLKLWWYFEKWLQF